MRSAIIISLKDPAGLNIQNKLIKRFGFQRDDSLKNSAYRLKDCVLYSFNEESVYCENIDEEIDADIFIFASKHESKSHIPSLSVHSPGNWADAQLGGKERSLCVCPASYLKQAMIRLIELAADTDYEVIQECTHHGPYIKKPCFFIEIGSSSRQWGDDLAGKIIAETIMHLVDHPPIEKKSVFGIGGPHHTPNFKKIILNSEYAPGHVCPKYKLENLDKEMIIQSIERTKEQPVLVVLDWKGLQPEKARIVEILKEMGIEYKKTKDF